MFRPKYPAVPAHVVTPTAVRPGTPAEPPQTCQHQTFAPAPAVSAPARITTGTTAVLVAGGTAAVLVVGAVLVSMLLAVAITAASLAVCAVVVRSLLNQNQR